MSYTPPYVDASGLHLPSYQDILDFLQSAYLSIYGQSVYLGNDSSDHQEISSTSLALADAMQGLQLSYNQFSPQTAVGAGLDALCKLVGISRKPATHSICLVNLTGTPNATISNGVVQDTVYGLLWDLSPSITLDGTGNAQALVICEQLGNFNITAPGQLSIITNPQSGWTGVDNGSNVATPGQPVESDSQLRARFFQSVAKPSRSLVAGTLAQVEAVSGVVRAAIEHNPTGSTDSNGCPPHSITVIVQGGDPLTLATTIYTNKSEGCATNGTTVVNVLDPNTQLTEPIQFDVISAPAVGSGPGFLPIYVVVQIHGLTPAYTSSVTAAIQSALVSYLGSLAIGETVTQSALYAVAMSQNTNLQQPIYSVRGVALGLSPGPVTTIDIPVPYNQVASSGGVQINSI